MCHCTNQPLHVGAQLTCTVLLTCTVWWLCCSFEFCSASSFSFAALVLICLSWRTNTHLKFTGLTPTDYWYTINTYSLLDWPLGLKIHYPPCVCPLSTRHYTSDQISQAFPLRICILQVIKYWRWEWPRNKADHKLEWVTFFPSRGLQYECLQFNEIYWTDP